IGLSALFLIAATPSPSKSTDSTANPSSLQLSLEKSVPFLSAKATEQNNSIDTDKVQLDGRNLFVIAAPALTQTDQASDTTPIAERVRGIETTLQRIANSEFDPEQLEVTAEVDASSNLPVISINDQYLMTVTTLDAQLQVQEPERWADQLTGIIENALIRAHQERQPEYLTRQSLIASVVIVAILCISWVISQLQRRLRVQRRRLERQIPPDPEVTDRPASESDSHAVTVLQQQRTKRRSHNLSDIQNRLLRLLQVSLWAGGLFFVLGLFPYSRWLQPLLFSAPLKLLGIILGIYVLMRVSDVLIDRFAEALAKGKFIDPGASQRIALRVSTFSRVLKSGAAVIWVAIGLLSSLSVVGVNLIPLLAGAGIIGLAISFAAQNLIKDIINGLLIISEDQYAIGDVIIVGEVSGFVENMNLRITQLRDSEGQLITIPNSSITVVRNLSKDWSRVDLTIDLAYGTDPDHALTVIRELARALYQDPEWHSKMPDPPEVLGIDEVNHTGILIRVWIKTLPLQQWLVAREFRRRLTLTLEREGLAIGVPQQSLWFRSSSDLDTEKLDGVSSKSH
ncbi:MAG TPA: mechanosensitive ion channel family protein, partial [Allocoleopsis sp.]